MTDKTTRFIYTWLGTILFMVLAMILIGGVTRLTDSGLSMVEWKPLLGILPPLNEAQWSVVFEKYKLFPEYQIVNQRMNLEEFKFIYFWEYFHRIFGRLIGIVFFFPLAYLLIKKKVNKSLAKKLITAFLLGGSQGLLGWFMVKSGLVDKPDVSHFRLAAHFSLALIIMGYIYWLMMQLKLKVSDIKNEVSTFNNKSLIFFALILIVQVIYGAFVAGLDAGIGFNTFPLMGKHFIPPMLLSLDLDLFINGNAGVQFIHRILGMTLLVYAFYFLIKSRAINNRQSRISLMMISHMTFLQFGLGVSTLVLKVPLILASVHQIGACVLIIFTLRALYIFTPFDTEQTEKMNLEENVILTQ